MGVLDILRAEGAELLSDPIQIQRALVYIRVSHEDSAERGTSIETQRQDIQRYAASEGIEIVEWFEEPGKSAFKDDGKRVQFARMIAMAKARSDVSLILVWKSDRFSRNRYQAAAVKGELAKCGVRVLSVLEPYDVRTTSGMVVESVTDVMNQIRSIEIGQVTHRNMLTNCEMRDPETGWSYKNGGWAQFGYRNHRVYADSYREYQRESHCVWLLNEKTIAGKPIHEWARTMLVDWRLREQVGPDVIARRLTEAGVPTPSGRTAWSDSTINSLIMPERLIQYAGYGTWNKLDYRNGGKRQKDRSEWKIIEKAHPAIITEEEADAIQAIREARASTSRPGRHDSREASPYILTRGLLTCGRCGANLVGKKQFGDDYYICGAQVYRHGADCGKAWAIRREVMEKAAFDCIQMFLAEDPQRIKDLVLEHNKWVASERALQLAEGKVRDSIMERLRREMDELIEELAQGLVPAAAKATRDKINQRAERLQRVEAIGAAALPEAITARDVQKLAEEARQIAESRDPTRKRSAIRQYIAAMIADPEECMVRVRMHPIESQFSVLGGSARGS